MKFTTRMDEQLAPPLARRPPGVAHREKMQRRAAARARREERVRRERERVLSEADRALAQTIRLPRTRAERVEMARSLLTVGDRERTLTQVGAIMGITANAVSQYLHDPEGEQAARYYQTHKAKIEDRRERDRDPEPEPTPTPTTPTAPSIDGDWVHARRKGLNLSQRALAREIGVHHSLVQQWEHGDVRVTPGYYAALRRVLLG